MTKQEIIAEIQRIASLTEGAPPGLDRFCRESGLGKHEFIRYWPRWSEALRESGLAPNQLQTAYSEDYLIEKKIGLTREIGRFPVFSEITTKFYSQKGFPNTSTFQNRLGSKSQMISKVQKFCRQNQGFEDVIGMCETASKSKSDEAVEEGKGSVEQTGFVYLIKSARYYKIGKTRAIGRREYDLAIQLAEKPTTIHVIKTDDSDGVECYWHRRFAAKRKNGRVVRSQPFRD